MLECAEADPVDFRKCSKLTIIHADGSRGLWFSPAFVSVCLSVYPQDISKTGRARITKLDTKMFYQESWTPIYFWDKRSNIKLKKHKTQRRGCLHSC